MEMTATSTHAFFSKM